MQAPRTFLLAAILLPLAAHAAQPFCGRDKADPIDIQFDADMKQSGGITVEIRAAQSKAYDAWDRRLNDTYKSLQSSMAASDRSLLTASQREWLKFRDAQNKLVWSQSLLGREGTIGPVVAADWMRDILKQRVCDLERANELLRGNGKQ